MSADGQDCVQKQDPLLGPGREAAVVRNQKTDIIMKFLVDILERRRDFHPLLYRETETMGLSRFVIWILPQDHNLDLGKRGQVESVEDILRRGINRPGGIFLMYKLI